MVAPSIAIFVGVANLLTAYEIGVKINFALSRDPVYPGGVSDCEFLNSEYTAIVSTGGVLITCQQTVTATGGGALAPCLPATVQVSTS
jgi:hypothetical protein